MILLRFVVVRILIHQAGGLLIHESPSACGIRYKDFEHTVLAF